MEDLPLIGWWFRWRNHSRMVKEARDLAREARRILRKHAYRIPEATARDVRGVIEELHRAIDARDSEAVKNALGRLDDKLDRHLAFARKSTLREYVESIGAAVAIALFLRAFCVEAFKIPSGSMLTTLEVGDHIFVNKFIYGLQVPFTERKFVHFEQPRRGDVVVFIYPREPDKDFIKRVVALGGDQVEVVDNRLIVNGRPVDRHPLPGPCRYKDYDEMTGRWEDAGCRAYEEELDGVKYKAIYDVAGSPRPNYGPHTVAPGHVFVMGDNRDNSHDSRFWPEPDVPLDFIRGRAWVIWLSWGPDGMRWNRVGHRVHAEP